jgi:GNAT superfamily N-acetyltransferase
MIGHGCFLWAGRILIVIGRPHFQSKVPMTVTLRRVERRDVVRILELKRQLAEYDQDPKAVTITLSEAEDSGFGANPVWWGFVAEVDGVIRGYTIYYIRFSTWKGQLMWLEDLYVEPDFRRKGIGTALFEELVKEVHTRHLNGPQWFTLKQNEVAAAFCAKVGAKPDPGWENGNIQLR